MKQISAIILSSFLFLCCKSEATSGGFEKLSEELQPSEQIFEINPTQDNLITCENGTLIFLEANLFVRQDGTSPTGNVLIEVREYYSTKDLISRDLSTKSDSLMLVSGGMVEISAKNSDQECFVNDGMAYTLFFPRNENTDGQMKLFYNKGTSDSEINWSLSPEKIYNSEKKKLVEYDDESDSLLSYSVGWNDNYGIAHNGEYDNPDFTVANKLYQYTVENFIVPSEMIKRLCENPDEFYSVAIDLDENARISNVDLYGDSSPFDEYIKTFFDTISIKFGNEPHYDPITPMFHIDAGLRSKSSDFTYSFNEKYSDFRNKALQNVDNAELNYYVLNSISLGLINCDYFYKDSTDKIDFFVSSDIKEASKVYLIFEDIRSMMVESKTIDNKYIFKNVPDNMNAKIVCINYSESHPQMCVERVTLSQSGIQLKNFRSFTLDELDEELTKL